MTKYITLALFILTLLTIVWLPLIHTTGNQTQGQPTPHPTIIGEPPTTPVPMPEGVQP
jgi:hypothetical protein